MVDQLHGFRPLEGDDLSPEERTLRTQMERNAGLLHLVEKSEAMRRWLDGSVGSGIQDEIEARLGKAMGVWLTATDPVSPEVLRAHYEARVCVGIIKSIEDIIDRGRDAAKLVRESDAQANAELGNG